MFTLISDVIADNLFLFRVLGSILIFVLFWAFKGTITKTVVKLLTKLLNRSRQIADQSTLRFVLGPLKHFLAISGLYLALMNLHPGAGWSDFFLKVYRIAVIVLISIVLLRLCDCASDNLFQPFGKQEELENRLNKTLMTLLKKAAKVLILIIAGIAVLSETGINVATLITGIGLGGLTIALAAQDTAQNLFGGLVILLDRPFSIGDWITVGDVSGEVVDINFRSTKVRALDNSVYILTNSTVSSATINNGTLRNKRLYRFTLGVTYDTTRPQLEQLMTDLTAMLKASPYTYEDSVLVELSGFGASSIDLLVSAYLRTADMTRFLQMQNDLNLDLMDVMQKNGVDFAFPSTTVYLEKNSEN